MGDLCCVLCCTLCCNIKRSMEWNCCTHAAQHNAAILAIDPHPGRGQVGPDQGSAGHAMAGRWRHRWLYAIGKLDKGRPGQQPAATLHIRRRRAMGKLSRGRPETMALNFSGPAGQGAAKIEGVPLDHVTSANRRPGKRPCRDHIPPGSAAPARYHAPAEPSVITPVPGPSSSTGPERAGSTCPAMARARPGWRALWRQCSGDAPPARAGSADCQPRLRWARKRP